MIQEHLEFSISDLSPAILSAGATEPGRAYFEGAPYELVAQDCQMQHNQLVVYDDGFVIGHTLSLADSSKKVVRGGYSYSRNWATRGVYTVHDGVLRVAVSERIKKPGASLVLGVGSHFGHFFVDFIDRIQTDAIGEYDHLIVDDMHPHFFDWLEAFKLSLPEGQVSSLKAGQILEGGSVACYTGRSIKPCWAPQTVDWIRERLEYLYQKKSASILIVTRASANTRRLLNVDQISEALPDAKFVDCGLLTFRQQVEVFSAASIVISPIGSDLFNLVHCRPGTAVVCICDASYAAAGGDNFRMVQSLTSLLKLNLTFLLVLGDGQPYEGNFVVPINDLTRVIKEGL